MGAAAAVATRGNNRPTASRHSSTAHSARPNPHHNARTSPANTPSHRQSDRRDGELRRGTAPLITLTDAAVCVTINVTFALRERTTHSVRECAEASEAARRRLRRGGDHIWRGDPVPPAAPACVAVATEAACRRGVGQTKRASMMTTMMTRARRLFPHPHRAWPCAMLCRCRSREHRRTCFNARHARLGKWEREMVALRESQGWSLNPDFESRSPSLRSSRCSRVAIS